MLHVVVDQVVRPWKVGMGALGSPEASRCCAPDPSPHILNRNSLYNRFPPFWGRRSNGNTPILNLKGPFLESSKPTRKCDFSSFRPLVIDDKKLKIFLRGTQTPCAFQFPRLSMATAVTLPTPPYVHAMPVSLNLLYFDGSLKPITASSDTVFHGPTLLL